MNRLIISLFPGVGLLDMAFEEAGFTVVRGPDVIWGGDVRRFNPPAGVFAGVGASHRGGRSSRHVRRVELRGRIVNATKQRAAKMRLLIPSHVVVENAPARAHAPRRGERGARTRDNGGWLARPFVVSSPIADQPHDARHTAEHDQRNNAEDDSRVSRGQLARLYRHVVVSLHRRWTSAEIKECVSSVLSRWSVLAAISSIWCPMGTQKLRVTVSRLRFHCAAAFSLRCKTITAKSLSLGKFARQSQSDGRFAPPPLDTSQRFLFKERIAVTSLSHAGRV
jgi:hypothetical protein